ncbi:unnamed protein product [Caenorhabditis angaria]|uniref:MSP domain-containing protein n=1 Tax=Caenorhabditis angaria TaxID=860376 RepID=A0A9P1I6T1_9PELO|nr:unnamed protein product [Caenorhabditis angaria]
MTENIYENNSNVCTNVIAGATGFCKVERGKSGKFIGSFNPYFIRMFVTSSLRKEVQRTMMFANVTDDLIKRIWPAHLKNPARTLEILREIVKKDDIKKAIGQFQILEKEINFEKRGIRGRVKNDFLMKYGNYELLSDFVSSLDSRPGRNLQMKTVMDHFNNFKCKHEIIIAKSPLILNLVAIPDSLKLKNETKQTTIVLHNESDCPILFKIKTSKNKYMKFDTTMGKIEARKNRSLLVKFTKPLEDRATISIEYGEHQAEYAGNYAKFFIDNECDFISIIAEML